MARSRSITYRVVRTGATVGLVLAASELLFRGELRIVQLLVLTGIGMALHTVLIVVLGEADDDYWS